ncbi:MAG: ATP-binding cassette domain-containing protein [Chloroflexi bacterium]|nr:ATP-binding cassette domain-containing protein [Chloroflexota bacterium]
MPSVEVNHISKTFGSVRAVDDVSFVVNPGEIFGLLGPNGAGKTTTIRVLLDIFKPDAGSVSILGGAMTEAKKNLIGYLPEERGLYQDISLDRCLTYLASLKGLNPGEAHQRIGEYLERFDLASVRQKKVKELSKGMQQKAQLIVALVHQPDLIIIDEPFASLDPINTQMVKDLLLEQRSRGATILMSTHQMHQVEELADRFVLIDHGQAMLYGELETIRRDYSSNDLLVRATTPLPPLPGVIRTEPHNGAVKLSLAPEVSPQEILGMLVARGICVEQFEIAMPTLDEIFIRVVQGRKEDKA